MAVKANPTTRFKVEDQDPYFDYPADTEIGYHGGRLGFANGGSSSFDVAETPILGPIFRFFGNTQLGPIHMGVMGWVAFICGGASIFFWLFGMAMLVSYDPIKFAKNFFVLHVDPAPARHMLWGFGGGLEEGGLWMIITILLTVGLYAWWFRIWSRARANGLKPYLAYGFASALFLYTAIYWVRPLLIGNWSEAPPHGFKGVLEWTNNISFRYGNFYYNPFHMQVIFCALGSTLLLSAHGATIWATAKYGAHEELEEIHEPGTGTERAQMFWRWTIGFNANAYSIHVWAFGFAFLFGVVGCIGITLTGTFIPDWPQWAQDASVIPPQNPPPNVYVPNPITNM
jgi:photosynthetic reaction center M subunit